MAKRLTQSIAAAAVVIAAAGIGITSLAQQANLGYQDTPLIPGTNWHVHDGTRPQPRIVDPGPAGPPVAAPADAVVLFDGKDVSKWRGEKGDCPWKVEDGYMETRGGQVSTRDEFGDCQLHLEFCEPTPPKGNGQGRGNSGVFMFGVYEIQVLDSFDNPTYPDGQAGSLYGQYPPLVNASRKPGEWQTYDIVFTAPRFKDGQLETPGYLTLLHNGVLVQNHVQVLGRVAHRALPKYEPHGEKGPIGLQDHGNPVRFRNIWIRPLPAADRT